MSSASLRINRLEIWDFRAISKMKLELGHVNILMARNATGKSSIRAAITTALCGETEWNGEGYPRLSAQIRSGAKKSVIGMKLEGVVGPVTREVKANGTSFAIEGRSGTPTEQLEYLHGAVGIGPKTLAAVLNTARVVEMTPKELATTVNRLVGASAQVDPQKFRDALVEAGIGPELADWVRDEFCGSIPEEPAAAVDAINAALREERKTMKKMLADAEARVRSLREASVLPEGVKPDGEPVMREKRKRLQMMRDTLVQDAAKVDGTGLPRMRAEHSTMVEALSTVESEIAARQESVDGSGRIQDAITAIEAKTAEVRAAHQVALSRLDGIKAMLPTAVGHCATCGHECPECAKTAAGRTAPSATPEDVAAAQQFCRDLAEKLVELMQRDDQERAALRGVERDCDQLVGLREHRSALAAKVDQMEKAIAELEAQDDPEARDARAQDLEKVDREIAECEDQIAAIAAYRHNGEHVAKAEADVRQNAAQVEELEQLVKTVDQSMVVRLSGGAPAVKFDDVFATALAGITDGEYTGAVEQREGGAHVTITRYRIGNDGHPSDAIYQGVPIQILSASEKFRVGIALQHAVLQLVPESARLMIVDGADILDEQNRAALLAFLTQHRDLYCQIIVTGTIQRDAVVVPAGLDWLRMWYLNGSHEPLAGGARHEVTP